MRQIDFGNIQLESFDAVTGGNHIWIVYSTSEKIVISIFDPEVCSVYQKASVAGCLSKMTIDAKCNGLFINACEKRTQQNKTFHFNCSTNTMQVKVNQMLNILLN